MDDPQATGAKRTGMADEDSLLTDPPSKEAAVHVRDYLRFTHVLKWSALGVLVIAFIVLLIL